MKRYTLPSEPIPELGTAVPNPRKRVGHFDPELGVGRERAGRIRTGRDYVTGRKIA